MTAATNWIEVDRAGLAQVIADRPIEFLLYELVQNALDEPGVELIRVRLDHADRRGLHWLVVEDDAPDGYSDIRHAWTMYAPSKKKADATKRGRFNTGCKMVLALAREARVVSTRSSVEFDPQRGRRMLKRRTESGTRFEGLFPMTITEADAVAEAAGRLLLPHGVRIEFHRDGSHRWTIEPKEARSRFEATLPTVFADDEGVLRRTARRTTVDVHDTAPGDPPTLHEMGIPVVELDEGFPYHLDVQQRVPLNQDRDNVTPSYLRKLRALALNAVAEELTQEQATEPWATDAMTSPDVEPKAVEAVLTARYGERRVSFDPSDPEANKLAVSKGYTVVHGASLPRAAWDNVRSSGAMLPAGKVTPSPAVLTSPNGTPPVPREQWRGEWEQIARWAERIWGSLFPESLSVEWHNDRKLSFAGCFGARTIGFNAAHMSNSLASWKRGDRAPVLELIIHEFGHHYSSDHLSSKFFDGLCRIGARLALDSVPS